MLGADFQNVKNAYDHLQTLTPKEKYKKIRSVAALAHQALKTAANTEEIAFYTEIFKHAGNYLLLSKAKSKEYELKGITEIKTLKTKLGVANVESGLIAVGDPELRYNPGENNSPETKTLIGLMKKGDFFCVGTGGDGTYDVILRVVDSEEPLVSVKEFKFVRISSPVSMIKIVSGRVRCSDPFDPDTQMGVGYELENGFYKVAFYAKEVRDKFFGYVVVLSKNKTWDEPPVENLQTL